MTLLIDTNIILDYILQRQPFFENAKSVMKLCSTEKIDGCGFAYRYEYVVYSHKNSR